jgi:hypothetical protein
MSCFEDGECAKDDDSRRKRNSKEFGSIMLPCFILLGIIVEESA